MMEIQQKNKDYIDSVFKYEDAQNIKETI